MQNYWHYEGFIYNGRDTVCELYGTEEQKNKTGKEIVKCLTDTTTTKILFFGLGLIASAIVFLLTHL